MKKIFFTIIIFLFVTLTTGHAQFFKNPDTEIQSSNSGYSGYSEGNNNSGGFFKNGTNPANPGNRPGQGGAIGVDAPIGDGVKELIICCIVLCFVIYFDKKRKNKKKMNEDEDEYEI